MEALVRAPIEAVAARLAAHAAFLATPHPFDFETAKTLLVPWAVHFVFSWVGFGIYIAWDLASYRAGTLETAKLPSRHPVHELQAVDPHTGAPLASAPAVLPCGLLSRLSPFAYNQAFMVPLVLYNQLVVWPLVSLLLVWPQWAASHRGVGEWVEGGRRASEEALALFSPLASAALSNSSSSSSFPSSLLPLGGAGGPPSSPPSQWPLSLLSSLLALPSWLPLVASFVGCMLVSDALWYSSHRLMHTRWCWTALHKMHHVAPQVAISATYVHPLEYALFTASMQIPFAVAGFPLYVHAVPLAWGMLTGSGAHSGYSGDFANGDKHNAHHYYHNVNFGLLMVADSLFGTAWSPGDPPPPKWSEAEKIWSAYGTVHGSEGASTFAGGAEAARRMVEQGAVRTQVDVEERQRQVKEKKGQ